MPSLSKFLADDRELSEKEADWLQHLVGDWNLLSDLLRADLVLWIRSADGPRAVAHCRPATGATVYYEDPVGTVLAEDSDSEVQALLAGAEPSWEAIGIEREGREARGLLVRVRKAGRTLGVLAAESPASDGEPSQSERRQQQLGRRILEMLEAGAFPIEGAPIPPRRGAPRVGDGVVEVDAAGIVQWTSPNAQSAFHRFGIEGSIVGSTLAEHSTEVLQSRSPVDESLPLVLMGRAAWRSDMQARGGTLSLRAVPLTEDGQRTGAIILVRDVTELRRRERELITKDATIREVHHRVKNNLQTVAALLRMQSRRMKTDEAREALTEAMRRVSTIALVHESLLQGSEEAVHFDEVIDRCLRLAVDAASASVHRAGTPQLAESQVEVRTEKIGRVGTIRAEEATPLALVVTELATNAVEHGLSESGGTLTIRSERTGSHLVIAIEDDGNGMGAAKPTGLGTNIALTLVQGQLGGTLTWGSRDGGGTSAVVDVYLDPIQV
ncbi:histidine kinase N-terminal domain-containing protein [Brachybacterium sp. J144]|uniref:sensor histidine kinase n=1 Tax=Brachybacterium sp. J144 TaxID=3116487 RepID=UPI002E75E2F4|nr:histidine kinase N-terminal domain-containing protein [Brachybacterium sp. J144]MEE1649621.1 histidine kinase N-terminal domain-containing protein [Brachybacterium sp. J144]